MDIRTASNRDTRHARHRRAAAERPTPPTARPGRSSRRAPSQGPLFVVVGLVQALTREGFDLTRHPLSLLSLGDRGWVQIANFIVAGVLMLAFAVGTRRSLGDGPGRPWAPVLFGLYGVGLVLGGAFTADPALGFLAGTPDGYPHRVDVPRRRARLRRAAGVPGARGRDLRRGASARVGGHRAAAAWSRVIGVACLLLCIPFGPAMSVRLFVGVALGFAWITAYAISLLRERPITARRRRPPAVRRPRADAARHPLVAIRVLTRARRPAAGGRAPSRRRRGSRRRAPRWPRPRCRSRR